jgi:hypothetical protein
LMKHNSFLSAVDGLMAGSPFGYNLGVAGEDRRTRTSRVR